MQYIFPIEKSSFGFTCRECGAIAGQKSGVCLNPYLVVTTFTNSDTVLRYAEEMVCDGCVERIKSLNVRPSNTNTKRPVKRFYASELNIGLDRCANDWPFVLEIEGEKVARYGSIPSWLNDCDSQWGYVYDNESVVYLIFEDLD